MSISDLLSVIETKVDLLERLPFRGLQSFKSLLSWPIGEARFLSGNPTRKVLGKKNLVILECTIPPFGGFEDHFHDVYTRIKVISGEMTLPNFNNRKMRPGDEIVLKPFTAHRPINVSPVKLILRMELSLKIFSP